METLLVIRGGVLILQRRFDNVTFSTTETSPTIEAAMGCGGGNIPIVLCKENPNELPKDHRNIDGQ